MHIKFGKPDNYIFKLLFIIISILIVTTTNTFSQFDFGITAGGNFSTLSKIPGTEISGKPGFQFGLTMITPINKKFHIKNDILFIRNNIQIDYEVQDSNSMIISGLDNYGFIQENLSVSSIRVPFTFNYIFQSNEMNFYFGIGFYYEYYLSGKGKLKLSNKKFESDVSFRKVINNYWQDSEPTDEDIISKHVLLVINRNQIGLVANIGLSRKKWGYNLSYEPSLIQYPIAGWGHLRQWKFGVTYLLDFRKKKE